MQINLLKQLKKHLLKQKNNKHLKSIPKEVRISFGKFYVFSILIFVFLLVYSFIISKISVVSNVSLLILLPILYVVMLIDNYRKCKHFKSTLLYILVFLNLIMYICAFIKFIYFT